MIDRLPRDSAYFEALTDDEELAVQIAATAPEPNKRPAHRRMTDWSPTVEVLTAILDRLAELTQTVAALGGAKPRKVPRAPHPVTAMERVRNRRRQQKHESLVSRVLPHRPPPATPSS
jgi:transposase